MKIFISVPMKNKTDEEIKKEIAIVENIAKAYFPEENALGTLEFVNNFKEDPVVGIDGGFLSSLSISRPKDKEKMPLYDLGVALQKMSDCDAIMVPSNWAFYSGCDIELEAADKYGIDIYSYEAKMFS